MPFLPTFDLRGGRNGADAPDVLAENQCQDAVNVDWYRTRFARRRAGSASAGFTNVPFTGTMRGLFRHVPSADETAAELWAIDSAGNFGRLTGGTAWTNPSFKDGAFVPNPLFRSAVSLNGKFFMAYLDANTNGARLHCWDPVDAIVRRTGLAQPSVGPTVANTAGAGTYAAITAYWRIRWVESSGGVTVRRSEPSVATAFTPSGANVGITITRPTAAGEGETGWELEVSTDNITFYVVAGDNGFQGINPAIAIATTSTPQTLALSTVIPQCGLSPSTGTYTVQKGYAYLAADQNRLLGFGNTDSGAKQNRVEFSAVVGSLNVGDAERVDTTTGYYVDLDEKDSSNATGLAGPVNGSFFAFKERQTWMLTPTGIPANPYSQRAISKTIGAVAHNAIVVAEDEQGNPAIYWLSRRGVYRYGVHGLQSIGEGVEDLILGPTSTMNLNFAGNTAPHGVYFHDLRQLWWWFPTGVATTSNTLIVYTLGRDGGPSGWSRYTGAIANAAASCMFSRTPGASMSKDLVPYISQSDAVTRVWKCDTGTQDGDSTNYQAYVRTRTLRPWGLERNGSLNRSYLFAKALAGVTIRQTINQDYGAQTARTSDTSIAPAGTETQIRTRFEDSAAQGIGAFDLQIGDTAAANVAQWTLVGHTIEFTPQEVR